MIKFEQNNLTINVGVSPEEETVWLTLNDLCVLFDRDKSVISRHIKNIFEENELDENQVVAKNATTASDGKKSDRTSSCAKNAHVLLKNYFSEMFYTNLIKIMSI